MHGITYHMTGRHDSITRGQAGRPRPFQNRVKTTCSAGLKVRAAVTARNCSGAPVLAVTAPDVGLYLGLSSHGAC